MMEWIRPIQDRVAAHSFLSSYVPTKRIDPHTVLVIPGLLASDFSTRPMRSYLDRLGYTTVDWGLGRNLARLEQVEVLSALVQKLSTEEPISIIGWSLGGLYARRLADLHPDKVRKVITLASPYKHLEAPNNASWLFSFFQLLRGKARQEPPAWVVSIGAPVAVPSVAFYTKQDGIVPWQACCDFEDPTDHQNIEVYTGHNALGVNKYVLEKLVEVL